MADQMHFYYSSTSAWQALSLASTRAQRSIDFEEYIVRDDRIGTKLLEILVAKAREGLRVRVLLDAFGSRRLRHHPMISLLHGAGVQLLFFRPFDVRSVLSGAWLPRDHVKGLHVDGTDSYIGSMCVADHMLGWRDTLVAFDGHLAVQAQADFERTWSRAAGLPPSAPSGLGASPGSWPIDTYVAQDPFSGNFAISDALLMRIGQAQESICLASPYFFPTRACRNALAAAHQRGVAVTLILSSHTDIQFADMVTRGLIVHWHRLGMHVLFYQPGVLHAKYAIIDDIWATVGSCNFDVLSLRNNREANLILQDADHVAKLVAQSKQDRLNCLPTPAFSGDRSGWDKMTGQVGALLARCL